MMPYASENLKRTLAGIGYAAPSESMRVPATFTAKLQELQAALVARRETVATAESCTGGMVAMLLTDLPGSSAVFVGGIAAYANAVKTAALGVDAALIERVGAVSAEVAEAMARGARERLGAAWAVSLTGIAGPDGGRPGKPVGTVFFGLAGPDGVTSEHWTLPGDRAEVRWQAATRALTSLAAAVSRCAPPSQPA